MFGLLLVAVTFAVYCLIPILRTSLFLLWEWINVSLGWLFVPFVVLVLIASTNAVNITDGWTDLQQE